MYQSIYLDLLHGSLAAAESRAAQARRQFSPSRRALDAAWGLEFRLLEAEILARQKHPREVLALLADGTAFPSGGALAIKRQLLESRAHAALGDAAAAARELIEARRLAQGAQSALIGEVLRAEALALRDAGKRDEAEEKFRSSLAVARAHGDALLEAADRVDIGYASLQRGHYDEALMLSQQAASFAASVEARRQRQLALGNVGWAYMNLGDFENALANFEAAEHQALELDMGASRVLWLADAGLAAYKLGFLERARAYDEDALRLASTLPADKAGNQIVNIEANLALLLCAEGRYEDAKAHSDAALRAAQGSTDANVAAYARFLEGLIAARQGGGDAAARLLTGAREATTDPEMRMEMENALARLEAARRRPRAAERWYLRSIATFEETRAAVRSEALRLSSFAFGDSVYRDYADFLIDAHRPDEALQLLDRSRARTLEEGLGFTGAPGGRVQARADPRAIAQRLGASILFYSLGSEKSYLWAISARATRLFTLPREPDIRALIEEYQRAIQKSSDPLKSASPAARSLYEVLIKPAAALIASSPRVYVVPDGILHALNPETLLAPGAAGLHYWIEEATVTTTSSIRILSRLPAAARAGATRELLLIGNPVAAGSQFEALPNAPLEIERIARHFASGQTVLTEARAVPAAYATSGPEQFRYIHFVAHGTASRSSPLDSAVVLSPAPANPQDFKLYARDIVRHPLRADLVTISACYGSGVRAYAGEGLVGLAWAFLRAGSHNVIGALWQADDAATPLLMDRLYAELAAGRSPDAALRTAKLALIHSTGVYRKPFYWGAFQLYAGA